MSWHKMELKEMQTSYERKQKFYKTRQENLKEQIAVAEKKLENMTYPHHHDNYIKPIALELLKHFKNRTYEILGPFGMNCESSIHLTKNGVKGEDRFKNNNIISITFRLHHGKKNEPYLVLVSHQKNTGTYGKGSIGEMNGGNYETVEMPETIEELVKFVRKENRKKREKKQ